MEFWIKATVATAAGDLQLLLDNTANCASPVETIDLPALAARTWTYVKLTLANPNLDTAIISVGLKYTLVAPANTVWVGRVRAVDSHDAVWYRFDPLHYSIDAEARQIRVTAAGRMMPRYGLLRFIGYRLPAVPTLDTDTLEVDAALLRDVVLARLAPSTVAYLKRAETRLAGLPTPQGIFTG